MEGEYTPTYSGSTMPGEQRYEVGRAHIVHADGRVYVQACLIFRADTTAYTRSLDKAQRTLNRLRYPPKEPAHGSVSRRREKLQKAGIRR